jgi:hypothetical protein
MSQHMSWTDRRAFGSNAGVCAASSGVSLSQAASMCGGTASTPESMRGSSSSMALSVSKSAKPSTCASCPCGSAATTESQHGRAARPSQLRLTAACPTQLLRHILQRRLWRAARRAGERQSVHGASSASASEWLRSLCDLKWLDLVADRGGGRRRQASDVSARATRASAQSAEARQARRRTGGEKHTTRPPTWSLARCRLRS